MCSRQSSAGLSQPRLIQFKQLTVPIFASKVPPGSRAIAPSKIKNQDAQASATTACEPATFRKYCLPAFCLRYRFRTAETGPQMRSKSARQRRQDSGPREIIALTRG